MYYGAFRCSSQTVCFIINSNFFVPFFFKFLSLELSISKGPSDVSHKQHALSFILIPSPFFYSYFSLNFQYLAAALTYLCFSMMPTAFLIPYMAIRLNDNDVDNSRNKLSKLGTVMTSGAPVVGLIGGVICLISALWAFFGRGDGGFGSVPDRLEFFANYVGSERLAHAFLWDICLYAIFQPWLIGDNLQNVKEQKVQIVSNLRFIPVVGLVVYLLNLNYAGVERDREN